MILHYITLHYTTLKLNCVLVSAQTLSDVRSRTNCCTPPGGVQVTWADRAIPPVSGVMPSCWEHQPSDEYTTSLHNYLVHHTAYCRCIYKSVYQRKDKSGNVSPSVILAYKPVRSEVTKMRLLASPWPFVRLSHVTAGERWTVFKQIYWEVLLKTLSTHSNFG